MIVEKLTKKNNKYIATISGKEYEFDEEVVIEYRLVKGKEITKEILAESINKNENIDYYYKARDYAIRYGKSKLAVMQYLKDKGLVDDQAKRIVDSLEKSRIINDDVLIENIIASYIRRHYGRLLMQHKLIEAKFSVDLIQNKLDLMDYDLYIHSLNKLYEKVKNKYTGTSYIKKQKIKKYLLSKGYTYEDLNCVHFEE